MMGRKTEDSKVETQKKQKIATQTQMVFLQNNEFRELTGLKSMLTDIMYDVSNILWLDLSYNYLVTIEDELMNFP